MSCILSVLIRQTKEGPKESNEVIHINSLVSETLQELLVLWQGSQL